MGETCPEISKVGVNSNSLSSSFACSCFEEISCMFGMNASSFRCGSAILGGHDMDGGVLVSDYASF